MNIMQQVSSVHYFIFGERFYHQHAHFTLLLCYALAKVLKTCTVYDYWGIVFCFAMNKIFTEATENALNSL